MDSKEIVKLHEMLDDCWRDLKDWVDDFGDKTHPANKLYTEALIDDIKNHLIKVGY
jgi:hypothetical protein